MAGALSGYVVVYGLIIFTNRSITMLEVWRGVEKYELDIFLQWEIQFIVAVIIFSATIFYLLIRELARKNPLR